MKVVILCGGKGERMGPISSTTPKPLIQIGEKPVLWHIMKTFESHGFKDFILCLGYKGDKIREHFSKNYDHWNIEFVDTGLESKKSERLAMVKDLIKDDNFMLSYGDDLSDVDIEKVVETHKKMGRMVTLTAVKLTSPFGLVDIQEDSSVTGFKEKPVIDKWINGGYMVLNRKIFDHLHEGELEDDVFKKLVEMGEICAHKHPGRWKSMSTLKDNTELNNMWNNQQAYWKKWDD